MKKMLMFCTHAKAQNKHTIWTSCQYLLPHTTMQLQCTVYTIVHLFTPDLVLYLIMYEGTVHVHDLHVLYTYTLHVHNVRILFESCVRKLLKLTCTVQFVYEGTVQRTVHINSYGSTTGTVQQRESECVQPDMYVQHSCSPTHLEVAVHVLYTAIHYRHLHIRYE